MKKPVHNMVLPKPLCTRLPKQMAKPKLNLGTKKAKNNFVNL